MPRSVGLIQEIQQFKSDFHYVIFQEHANKACPLDVSQCNQPLKQRLNLPRYRKYKSSADNHSQTFEYRIIEKLNSFFEDSLAPSAYIKALKGAIVEGCGRRLDFETTLAISAKLGVSPGGFILVDNFFCAICDPLRTYINVPPYLTEIHKPLFMGQVEQILICFLLNFCAEIGRSKTGRALECFFNKDELKSALSQSDLLRAALRVEPYLLQTKIGSRLFSFVSLDFERRHTAIANIFRLNKNSESKVKARAIRALLLLKLFCPAIACETDYKSLQVAFEQSEIIPSQSPDYLKNLISSSLGKNYRK